VKKAEKKTKPKKRKRKLGVVPLNHRQNTIIILPNQETLHVPTYPLHTT
jgi:hypothetical protein